MDGDRRGISFGVSNPVSGAKSSFPRLVIHAALRWISFALALTAWIPSAGAHAERWNLVVDATRSNLEWEYGPAPLQPPSLPGFVGRAPITPQGSLVLDLFGSEAVLHSSDLRVSASGDDPVGGSVEVEIALPFRGVPATSRPNGVTPDKALVIEAKSGTITRSSKALGISETRDLAINALTFRDDGGPREIRIDWPNKTWSLQTELMAFIPFPMAAGGTYHEETEIRLTLAGTIAPAMDPAIVIETPAHGSFTGALDVVDETVAVTGRVEGIAPSAATLVINGVEVAIDAQGDFETDVSLGTIIVPAFETIPEFRIPGLLHLPIEAEVTDIYTGVRHRDRIVVIQGESVGETDLAERGAILQLTERGLEEVGNFAQVAASDSVFDALPDSGFLIGRSCTVSYPGCIPSLETRLVDSAIGVFPTQVTATTVSEPRSTSPFHSIRFTWVPRNFVFILETRQTESDSVVCNSTLRFDQVTTHHVVSLAPNPSDQTELTALSHNPTFEVSGISAEVNCQGTDRAMFEPVVAEVARRTAPERIMESFGPALSRVFQDGHTRFEWRFNYVLNKYDGSGLLAERLKVDLNGLIRGPYVPIDEDGVSVVFDTRMAPLVVDERAPQLDASLALPGSFRFGAQTPAGATYDAGSAISLTAINQFLRARTEAGALEKAGLLLNAGQMSQFAPAFARLRPTTPLRIDLSGTLAPVMTGRQAPGDELMQVSAGQILARIVQTSETAIDAASGRVLELPPDRVWMTLAIDFNTGVIPRFDPGTGLLGLEFVLERTDVRVWALDNKLGGDLTLTDRAPGFISHFLHSPFPDLFKSLPIPWLTDVHRLVPSEIVVDDNHLVFFGDLELGRISAAANSRAELVAGTDGTATAPSP